MSNIKLDADDLILYGGADGRDTCQGLSDDQISEALLEEPILLCAAKWLSQKLGRIVTRSSIAKRIQASPRLQNVHRVSDWAHDQILFAQFNATLDQRDAVREAHHRRMHGPRCGARTRRGRPCQRKVVLGRPRCPNHGGLSTGPKTPEGKARSAEGRRQRWKYRRRAG